MEWRGFFFLNKPTSIKNIHQYKHPCKEKKQRTQGERRPPPPTPRIESTPPPTSLRGASRASSRRPSRKGHQRPYVLKENTPSSLSTPTKNRKIRACLLYTSREPTAGEGGSAGRTKQQPAAAVEDDAGIEGKLQLTKTTQVASPPRPPHRQPTHTPYLHRRNADPGIPHPPAAGAAAGGWEIPRMRRRTLAETRSPSNSPLVL